MQMHLFAFCLHFGPFCIFCCVVAFFAFFPDGRFSFAGCIFCILLHFLAFSWSNFLHFMPWKERV